MNLMILILSFALSAPASKSANSTLSTEIGKTLSKCYRMARARDYKLHGKFKVELTADSSGKISKVTFKSSKIKSLPLMRCIRFSLLHMDLKGKKNLTLKLKFPKMKQYTVWSGDVPIVRTTIRGIAARILLDDKSAGLKKGTLNLIRIMKNSVFNFHYHPKTDLLAVVVSGTGLLSWKTSVINTEFLPISSGTAFYIPAGVIHELKGNSDPPLVLATFYFKSGSKIFNDKNIVKSNTVFIKGKNLKSASFKKLFVVSKKVEHRFINFKSKPSMKPSTVLKSGKIRFFHVNTLKDKKFKFIKPRRGKIFGFVLNGGGNIKIKHTDYPINSGSGFYLPGKAVYFPAKNKGLNAFYIWLKK